MDIYLLYDHSFDYVIDFKYFLGLPPTNFSFPFNLQLYSSFYPSFPNFWLKNNKLEIKRNDLVIFKLLSIFLRRKLKKLQLHPLRRPPQLLPPQPLGPQLIPILPIMILGMNTMHTRKLRDDLRSTIEPKFQR